MTADTPATGSETVAAQLRTAMAQVPAAVSVVTTQSGCTPHGTTVSAFMSLSMDPPMVLVSLDNTSQLLARISTGDLVGVNVLSAEQADIAVQFARKDKVVDALSAHWDIRDGQPPRLPNCLAWISLTVTELMPAGDHTLVVGTVNSAQARDDAPLVYSRRTYTTTAELESREVPPGSELNRRGLAS